MAIDWTNVYQHHQGKWVVFLDDEATVVAAADTAKDALDRAKRDGFENVILSKMPADLRAFAV